MVGEGVMHACLQSGLVDEVLVVGRRPCGTVHPKLKEILLPDLFDLASVRDQLRGFDACYFCLGVSSIGMSESDYRRITYDLTVNFARTLSELSPGMTFCYISGAGTDSSENGRLMWARVKGKTENDLRSLGFKACYLFRPGLIEPTPGLRNTLRPYRYIGWVLPLLRVLIRSRMCTLREIGLAMLSVTLHGFDTQVLEVPEIVSAARAL